MGFYIWYFPFYEKLAWEVGVDKDNHDKTILMFN